EGGEAREHAPHAGRLVAYLDARHLLVHGQQGLREVVVEGLDERALADDRHGFGRGDRAAGRERGAGRAGEGGGEEITTSGHRLAPAVVGVGQRATGMVAENVGQRLHSVKTAREITGAASPDEPVESTPSRRVTRRRLLPPPPSKSEPWRKAGPPARRRARGTPLALQETKAPECLNDSTRRNDMSGVKKVAAVLSLSALALAPAGCGTVTGTAVGAGAGAAVGAGTGYGAGKGALIGAGVGAVGGAIYDITKKN